MFYLILLDSRPRLCISNDQMKIFIWAMKQCGAMKVPSFNALQAKQAELMWTMELKPTRHISAMENTFYTNGPAQTLKLVCLFV